MRSVFYPHLVAGPEGDPTLYVRVAHRREAILFDCGALADLPPREMSKVKYLFISHTHVDHFIDFDRLVRFFLYSNHTLNIFGPGGLAQQVENRLSSYTWNLTDGYPFEIRVHEWNNDALDSFCFRARNAFRSEVIGTTSCPDGRLLTTPAYHVTAVPLAHGSITSLAFCLEEVLHVAIHKDALEALGYKPGPWLTDFKDLLRSGESSEQRVTVPLENGGTARNKVAALEQAIAHTEPGMKICYVTDVSPSEENLAKIEEMACNAHLLVIEAPFAHVDIDRAHERNHLTARLAGEVARRAGAQRCLFFHFSPRYHEADISLQDEAEQAFLDTL